MSVPDLELNLVQVVLDQICFLLGSTLPGACGSTRIVQILQNKDLQVHESGQTCITKYYSIYGYRLDVVTYPSILIK